MFECTQYYFIPRVEEFLRRYVVNVHQEAESTFLNIQARLTVGVESERLILRGSQR